MKAAEAVNQKISQTDWLTDDEPIGFGPTKVTSEVLCSWRESISHLECDESIFTVSCCSTETRRVRVCIRFDFKFFLHKLQIFSLLVAPPQFKATFLLPWIGSKHHCSYKRPFKRTTVELIAKTIGVVELGLSIASLHLYTNYSQHTCSVGRFLCTWLVEVVVVQYYSEYNLS